MSRCRRTEAMAELVADPALGIDALTDEHWQHIGICADCNVAVRNLERLDHALAASLRSQPREELPPAVLATPALPRREAGPPVGAFLAVAAVIVLAVGVAAVAGDWLAFRGIGVTPSTSPDPSAPLTVASPGPTTGSSTPTPAASPSGEQTPAPTPAAEPLGLAVGRVAAVVDEPLVVRTAPGTDPDSTITPDRLWIGQRVRILDGPADVDGYTWWEVQVGEIRGWVADAELDDSAPWLAPLTNGEIYFWRHPGESIGVAPELFSMAADGSDERRIGDPRAAGIQLALSCGVGTWPLTWAPDGRRSTFELSSGGCDGEAWVMEPDTEAFRRLGEGRQPAWRPDGGAIVFAPNIPFLEPPAAGTGRLKVVDAASFGVTTLPEAGDTMFRGSPTWSPDRTHLVFDGSVPVPDDMADWQFGVYVSSSDGTDSRRLADGHSPRWSPDGRWIVYAVTDAEGAQTMWRMRPDGRDAAAIGEGFNPTFSPDGTRIAFVRNDSLWLSAPNGGEATQVLESTGIDGFAWAPSGDALVAAAHAPSGESTDLFVIAIDGDEPATTHLVDEAHNPSWRPSIVPVPTN